MESPEDCQKLQKDMDSLLDWCNEWGMLFNIQKCRTMHFGRKNQSHQYNIAGTPIETCKTYKDLGVYITENLTPTEQISKCIAKANSMVGMIKRTFTFIDKDILLRTSKVLVRPILEYCQQAWAPHLIKDTEELEKVQRRATKLVPELKLSLIHISEPTRPY